MKQPLTFLIADDEALIAMGLQLELEQANYIVNKIVSTGDAVLKELKNKKPDVILLDIRLAGQVDGLFTATELRNFCDSHIIFMTGYEDKKLKEKAAAIPNSSFLNKPIQLYEIETLLEKHLNRTT